MKHRTPNTRARRTQSSGFGIVEVLVALVVLSIGMLGIASLYAVTLRSSGSAISRMQAVNLANDIGDRIRANKTAGAAYAGAAADKSCNGTTDCSAADMAAHDLFLWREQITATMPGMVGTVAVDTATVPATYTVTLTWREPGDDADLSYAMRMQI